MAGEMLGVTYKGKRAGYLLRLPPDLKLRLRAEAVREGRSLNAEIVQRLRASLDGYRK